PWQSRCVALYARSGLPGWRLKLSTVTGTREPRRERQPDPISRSTRRKQTGRQSRPLLCFLRGAWSLLLSTHWHRFLALLQCVNFETSRAFLSLPSSAERGSGGPRPCCPAASPCWAHGSTNTASAFFAAAAVAASPSLLAFRSTSVAAGSSSSPS